MHELWAHRADLAEAAINDRHASRLWGIPGTNLAVVSWPALTKEKLFINWHYLWQAHYLECLVDATGRKSTKLRRQTVTQTIRGIILRNGGKLAKNQSYDDKAWLALALLRAKKLDKVTVPRKQLDELERAIVAGIDDDTGVLPWREGATYFNVPTNGPAALMMARTGRLDQAISLVDWIFDTLLNEDGLIMDGQRLQMHGAEIVDTVHPSNQGIALAACLEIALELRRRAGIEQSAAIEGFEDAELADPSMPFIMRIRSLVQAVATHMATPQGVVDWPTGDGDEGLSRGILMRYLADVAIRMPENSPANRAVKKIAARLVLATAEAAWKRRVEVDGLPVFSRSVTEDAQLPHNYGSFAERDLSMQLSGWMILEAAARVQGEPS